MIRIKEAVVVEGRYDRNKLSGLLDSLIVETEGFGIFRDSEKLNYIRRLGRERGLVLLLDSDGAGFVIRGKLSSLLPKEQVKHAYIPDVQGKEKRKSHPSKEGKLGVEGMSLDVLRKALLRAGATLEADESVRPNREQITKLDLYEAGLSGCDDSSVRRRELQKMLDLPERLSANGLLDALNALYSREQFQDMISVYFHSKE